ncbi:MAG: transcription termination factor NusA [Bacilli bacterium]|nr:transcription termination factor NusA [Bacilli bacterium]
MDASKFIDAVTELSQTKGLSRQAIIYALEEALKKAYIKYLGGGDDAVVTCLIDEEKGIIELAQVKKVVAEEDVEDDYLQISVDEANEGKKGKKYKVGDDYVIVAPVETLSKVTALAVKNNLRQRLAEAERTMLYEVYKDHIGEMMTGVVEKADERSVTVRIDRTSIELGRKDLIGDEYFRVGDPIKVYIQEVKASEPAEGKAPRGPQIQATRSSEGFLKRLFEEEIHEVYEGTVVIKAIARQAGVRSKVAVVSLNEDIDATGACIGQGGNRIQKVVSQLGNGKNKEKIDVINYSPNIGMFILEAIRPAQALGLNIDEEDKVAEILIDDGAMPLALGKFKSNLSLAKKITGYDIDFVEKAKADELGLIFGSVEEWKARAEEEKKEAERLAYIQRSQEEAAKREAELRAREEAARAAEEEAKKAEAPAEEEMPEVVLKPVAPKANVRPEEFPASAVNPAAAALAAERAAKEAKLKEEQEAAQPTNVTTTTTLEDLEKELESAKEKKTKSALKSKRPRKITEEEVSHETTVKPAVPTMPVYTEEELSQIESEEAEAFDDNNGDYEEEDYSEYDDYYDDDDPRN